jgi:tetratricopeptide (TPR) repeat protein
MRSLLDRLQRGFSEFIEQRNCGILILCTEGEQIAYGIRTLKAIEDSGTSDVFLLFPHAFENAAHYVSIVVERVKASYQAALEQLQLTHSPAAMQPFPVASEDARRPPIIRLREVLTFARGLLPPDSGSRLVCALMPMEIIDVHGYRMLIEEIVNSAGSRPWFSGMRIIVREDTAQPKFPESLGQRPFVYTLSVDLSNEAMAKSLQQEVEDPATPVDERAQSQLQLAFMDYSHQRYDAAITKFTDLLAYYQQTKNLLMQALVLNGLGDVYNRAGRIDLAQEWYERALEPAAESGVTVLLFTIGRNLGHLHYGLRQYAEAEIYFDGAQQLGLETKDPESKILALEWRGLSQEAQGALDRAAVSFEEAARAAREFGRSEHRDRNVGNLRRILPALNEHGRLARIERELAGQST